MFVPPYVVRGRIGRVHVVDFVIGRVDPKRCWVVLDRGGHAHPKLLAEPSFRWRCVTGTVAVARDTPADDFAGRPGMESTIAAVPRSCLLPERSIAVLVDGEVPDGNAGSTDPQCLFSIVEFSDQKALVPSSALVVAAIAGVVLPSHREYDTAYASGCPDIHYPSHQDYLTYRSLSANCVDAQHYSTSCPYRTARVGNVWSEVRKAVEGSASASGTPRSSSVGRAAVKVHERTCRPTLWAVHPIGAHVAVEYPMDSPALARLTSDLIGTGPQRMAVAAIFRRPGLHPAPAGMPQLPLAHMFEVFTARARMSNQAQIDETVK